VSSGKETRGYTRFRLLSEVVGKKATALLVFLYGVATLLTWLRDEIWNPRNIDPFRVINLIPQWHWYIWTIFAVVSFSLIALEGAYGVVHRLEAAILGSPVPQITLSAALSACVPRPESF
jgi:hypothetical protein